MELEKEAGICKKKSRELKLLSEKVIEQLKKLKTEEAFDLILEIEKMKKYKFTECECENKLLPKISINVAQKLHEGEGPNNC